MDCAKRFNFALARHMNRQHSSSSCLCMYRAHRAQHVVVLACEDATVGICMCSPLFSLGNFLLITIEVGRL